MKVYHLFAGNLLHITPQIIKARIISEKRISNNPTIEHYYCVKMFGSRMLYDNVERNPYPALFKAMNYDRYMLFYSHKELVRCLIKADSGDKVILHGFPPAKDFAVASGLLFILNNRLLKRTTAVSWGNDYKVKPTSFLKILYNKYLKLMLSNLKYVIAITTQDELEIKQFAPRAKTLFAPYVVKGRMILIETTQQKRDKDKVTVMVSHSGWPHNNHIHSFELLKRFVGKIRIVCPLCYGDASYIQSVIASGTSMFGRDFTFFTDLMPSEKYKEFMQTIDIYVTSADNQTGLGAVYINMRCGNKVFVSGNLYASLSGLHYHIYNTDTIADLDFPEFVKPLSKEQALINVDVYNHFYYDGVELLETWRRVYEY